jgi:hypothetical protein
MPAVSRADDDLGLAVPLGPTVRFLPHHAEREPPSRTATGISVVVPIRPLVKAEHAFAQLGRWRRLSRCYEGSEASAPAWLEVASVGYLAWRAVA